MCWSRPSISARSASALGKGLSQRRLIQLYAALLYNAHAKGFIKGEIYTGNMKAVCVPGLNCYSCPGAVGACPLGSLQNALATSGKRAPYYVLGILLLFGIMLGRTICGYLCPIGFLQEMLHKIPAPKIKKSRVTRALSYLKYVILAVFVVVIPLWYGLKDYPLPAFCKYICPAGTLQGAVGLLAHPNNADKYSMLGALFANKMLILLAVLLLCVFMYRAFCRFLCPLGAIYGLFARVAIVGVRVEKSACVHCGRCVHNCKMDVKRVGDHECIQCGECINDCPTNAISLKAGRITLRESKGAAPEKKKKHRVFSLIVLLVLVLVMVAANWPQKQAADIAIGSEVGMRAQDFTVPCYDGGVYNSADNIGKVQVINFWATWCGPCVKELPYFDQLQAAYPDKVSVVAIHGDLVTEDVPSYIEKLPYTIPFALDDAQVLKGFGGSTMLPHTVVLNENGVIVYNQVGSLTYEALEEIVLAGLEE